MDDIEDLTKEDLEAPLIGEDDDLLPEPPIPGPADDDLKDDLDRELPPVDSDVISIINDNDADSEKI